MMDPVDFDNGIVWGGVGLLTHGICAVFANVESKSWAFIYIHMYLWRVHKKYKNETKVGNLSVRKWEKDSLKWKEKEVDN